VGNHSDESDFSQVCQAFFKTQTEELAHTLFETARLAQEQITRLMDDAHPPDPPE
jgi:hypothetical protein